jgi:hypothetical protein
VDIAIQLTNIAYVVKSLDSIKDGAKWALHHAIKDSLDTARTELTRAIRERYNVPYSWVLGAIGKPIVNGLMGFLDIKGTRVPLYLFPHKEIYPFGVAVQEVKGGMPINLLHAFMPKSLGGKIYQREGESAPSYPIRWISGLSVPEMAGEESHIKPKVEKAMEAEYYRSVTNLIHQYLTGNLIPGFRNRRP